MNGAGEDRTLVVVPTYNERENLGALVPMILELEADANLDILVVDDASPDGTGEIADALCERHPTRVSVLHRGGKGGLGPAYLEGFRWALEREYGRICQMDADLSHPPELLLTLVEISESDEVDFVVGSRYVGGRVTVVNWPVGRLLVSLFGNLYARLVTGLPVSDATGGFNLFKRKVLATLDLDRIDSTGYTFQIELKFRSWQKGFKFVEIPIVFTERRQGESKMSKRIVREAVWKVWQLRLLKMIGRL